ncbi:oxidoreductase [Alteriqipengyuania lutimaris]|uniref:SDR family NAD(P)-dependent oxidoreductase n=1 Tax=Alteriqipengyuania lutimaris TaxID=1538146 RepID=A0A395LQ21_9SPHN|nr:oxidoreductase [Alteriqipengyuania lutimaris]MBB3033298.1 NAD(P)-dependent dehydrogenase (short-subunit alcohol dehydrogenase family) [Alteriqipengyuania lutimaris]RDS77664.1 SDR family NAD(P)-dependent oxidoreductase [Alteriqipengyuania lutimaris]
MKGFTFDDIPDQTGRTALVTGANTGIGFHIAEMLAKNGAKVLMGCRNRDKAENARRDLLKLAPGAQIEIVDLDLADMASVRAAAEGIESLDLLVNNAGIMWVPHAIGTGGAEMHFAVNHLGHFALTSLLLPALAKGKDPRVVVQSSIAHRPATIAFDNLAGEDDYALQKFYGQSKLANLMFAIELDRRLRAAGSPVASIACHPGVAKTELARQTNWAKWLMPIAGPVLNTARQGALPALQAAIDPAAQGGEYYGPYGFMELKGASSGRAVATAPARDPLLAARLWEISKDMTGVDPELAPAT